MSKYSLVLFYDRGNIPPWNLACYLTTATPFVCSALHLANSKVFYLEILSFRMNFSRDYFEKQIKCLWTIFHGGIIPWSQNTTTAPIWEHGNEGEFGKQHPERRITNRKLECETRCIHGDCHKKLGVSIFRFQISNSGKLFFKCTFIPMRSNTNIMCINLNDLIDEQRSAKLLGRCKCFGSITVIGLFAAIGYVVSLQNLLVNAKFRQLDKFSDKIIITIVTGSNWIKFIIASKTFFLFDKIATINKFSDHMKLVSNVKWFEKVKMDCLKCK